MNIWVKPAVTAMLLGALLGAACVSAQKPVPATENQSHQGKTEIMWYGHSAFRVVTPKGRILYLDPWLVNPVNPDGQADLDAVKKADLVLVSHGHFDHVGNAVDIVTKTDAKLVSTFDLGKGLVAYGGLPADRAGFDSQGNFGGTLRFFDGEVQVTFVPAVHSSGLDPKDMGVDEAGKLQYAGNPGGFLIEIAEGPTIYHTGDTDVFGDMAMLPRPVDVMLACIGDHFTMGPERAAKAVALVKPRVVLPMHYGTFPDVLPGSVADFRQALEAEGMADKLQPLALEQPVHY